MQFFKDGITGTSKTPVVIDYANKLFLFFFNVFVQLALILVLKRLFDALRNSKEIIESSASYLITHENKAESIFSIEDVRLAGNDEEKRSKLKPIIVLEAENDEKKVLLYNSNLNERNEIVSFRINTPHVEIVDSKGLFIENVQVSLVWPNMEGVLPYDKTSEKIDQSNNLEFSNDFDSNSFELLFEVNLPPLSLITFTIRKKPQSAVFSHSFNNVTFYYENVKSESVEAAKKSIEEK
jgi:hypothetical protein